MNSKAPSGAPQTTHSRRLSSSRWLAAVAVTVGLLAGGLASPAGAQADPWQPTTISEIRLRDSLIVNQEALLNVYRCLFDVDTELVPGGCEDGVPRLDPQTPEPFLADPYIRDLRVRDKLVFAQEALLNAYRCMFDIDTQIVPEGCPESETQ